jgi:hypothetical protein
MVITVDDGRVLNQYLRVLNPSSNNEYKPK